MVSITVGGKEYPLALTVQAFSDISDLCPGKDFDRINEINQLPTGELAKVSIKILAALSNGAEEQRAFSDPAYEKQPLNTKDVYKRQAFAFCPPPEAGAGASARSPAGAALPALFGRVSVFP